MSRVRSQSASLQPLAAAALAAFAAAVAATVLWSSAAKADAPDPSQVSIETVAFRGPGCRPGSVSYNVASDARALTLLFSDFVVEAGATQRLMSKMCELDLRLRVPSGWSYALAGVDVRGFAQLGSKDNKGRVHAMYAFGKNPEPNLLIDQIWKGPMTQDYQLHGDANLDTVSFSPCGGARTMRVRTRINAIAPQTGTASALITVDSLDGEVKQKYVLAWKRCPGTDPADTAPLPDLGNSFTAACNANELKPNGTLIATFTGEGVGLREAGAKRAAQLDAMKQCRLDRQSRPGAGNCVLDEASCSVAQN